MLTLAVLGAHAVLMIAAVLVVGRKPIQWAGSAFFLAGCFFLEWFAPVDISWRAIMALVRSPGLRLRLPAHSATMLNISSARVSMDTVGMGTSGRVHSNRRRVSCFTCA